MRINFFEQCKLPTTTAQQKRHVQRGNKHVAYNPEKVKYAKALLQAILSKHKPERPLEGPLVLVYSLNFPHTIKSMKIAIENDWIRVPKSTKPDIDNFEKLLFDAMQAQEYYLNDSQIFSHLGAKYHCDAEGIELSIRELNKGEAL